MEFYCINGKRPIRLSEATRRFAWDSMNHKYGLDTRKTPAVIMDDLPGYGQMTMLQRYDAAIDRIVREAPLRICPGEKLSGAATLGLAIQAEVPAIYHGKSLCPGVTHLTIDFESVVRHGTVHLEQLAQKALEAYQGTENQPFAESCIKTLEAMNLWRQRYLDALQNQEEYRGNYEALLRVPRQPARTFREAVQSIWFVFAFSRLTGNWPGIGRIDYILGPYLKKDLQEGRITLEEAREILAHLFIKGCEWICGGEYGSGDAQHYQNLVLSGVDGKGQDITNEVTYLVLDIWEEFGISDFPTTVRLNARTDEKLLRRVAEVMRLGGGILAVYNEDLILDALIKYGYRPEEAWKFANDGCWEVQIPGKTYFEYVPFDGLAILQKQTLQSYGSGVHFENFEALYQQYIRDLGKTVSQIRRNVQPRMETNGVRWKPNFPCTAISLFEQGCIEKGLSYLEGGPVYHICSPHIGGLPDVVNSLAAIKKLVFDDRKLRFPELMDILRKNWEAAEPLRQFALNRCPFYGNDQDEADLLAARIISDFADLCRQQDGSCPYRFPAGVSTFGRQLQWAPDRLATAYGRKAGEVLSGNFSPTPGTDSRGATAIIRSYCKSDLTRTVTGAALDLKLLPSAVNGEDGLQALEGLMRGFVALGGFFMQPDVTDGEILRKAQAHPEDYQNLSVRVSGWNARFVTLNKEWQDMLIAQVEA